MQIKRLVPIALDGFVVVIVVTVIAAIAALLPYASTHRRTTYVACVVIALLGAASVIYQMRRLYRLDCARELISRLLAEGQQIVFAVCTAQPNRDIATYPSLTWADSDAYILLERWCVKVETALRTLDESYVTRFHLRGSNQQDAKSMTIWKMNHRLETLASFLTELK